MKTIVKLAALASLVILLYVGGCAMPATPIDLIQPPQAEKEQSRDRIDEFQSLLPRGAQVLDQAEGATFKVVSFGDVDGDGIDEALVVYKMNPSEGKSLKAALFKQVRTKWQIVWDGQGFGYGLDYSQITDVNRDGVNDIVLGWSLGNAGTGKDIYTWRDGTLTLLAKEKYRGSS